MGHFDLVTSEIEGAGWHPFLTNLEDGFIIYHFEDAFNPELIYADWDVFGSAEHVRLVDSSEDCCVTEVARCDIVGSELDIVNDLRNFFWDIGDYVS